MILTILPTAALANSNETCREVGYGSSAAASFGFIGLGYYGAMAESVPQTHFLHVFSKPLVSQGACMLACTLTLWLTEQGDWPTGLKHDVSELEIGAVAAGGILMLVGAKLGHNIMRGQYHFAPLLPQARQNWAILSVDRASLWLDRITSAGVVLLNLGVTAMIFTLRE